jgi:indoleacetamide hydrolase
MSRVRCWAVAMVMACTFPVETVHASQASPESVRQRLEQRIAVIRRDDTIIKAFIDVDFDAARGAADVLAAATPGGALHGKVVAIKDNIHVAGFRTTAGANALAASRASPSHSLDAPVISALKNAGAIVVGTTNMDTWARGVRGVSEVTGQTANPLDQRYNAGGSSAGSAAAVAAGMADIAIGTDTCGSIRYPASSVGIYGLRPTWGAVSLAGIVPLAPGQDVVGPLAANPPDLRAAWSVLDGAAVVPETAPLKKRLGVLRGGGTIDRRWIAKAMRAGFVIVDAGRVPSVEGTNLVEVQFPIAQRAYLVWRSGGEKQTWLTSDGVIGTEKEKRTQTAIFKRRAELQTDLIDRIASFDVDALIQPVTTALPALLGQRQASGNCLVAAGAGLPALAVPGMSASSSRLSIGVELVGNKNSENSLIDIAEMIG